ncbi:MAG: DUF948 domain-containing protein [Nitrospirae bacterium]|nr:DUF948 domain-containing protein [Nitrospirota bacterium]
MDSVFLGLITLAFIGAVIVFIYVMVELRGAARALKEFLKTTEDTIKPTLEELQETLKSVRKVTDNVSGVTEDVRVLSSSVRDVGANVKQVSDFLEDVTSLAVVRVGGLKAGVSAALEVLLKNLFRRRGDA